MFLLPIVNSSLLPAVAPNAAPPNAASVVAAADSAKADIPTIDITNLPPAVFAAYPGLDNAVANDGRDDSETIRAVLRWLKAERPASSPPAATIYFPPGTFDMAKPLKLTSANITLKGAGAGRTTLQTTASFQVGTEGLPDGETAFDSIDQNAYLFTLPAPANNITFMDMTVTGPTIHGAILTSYNQGLTVKGMEFNNFLWSALRLFDVKEANIHNSVFVDAGGQSNGDQGTTGGSIFATYLKASKIHNNRFSKSGQRQGNVYGIKGREFRNVRIHHNTINTNFAIELPFENDRFVEIDHNYLNGAISLPKAAGGEVPKDGFTFHIHHNYFTRSYSLEWARNGVEVDHNVFAFDPEKDGGNLVSNFDDTPANGPTKFHNNLIVNPGRGVIWHQGVYNNFSFYNNEIIANPTKTPRQEGLFGFHEKTNFNTITLKDNLIHVQGQPRPLMRNRASYGATLENNGLVNITDEQQFHNPSTGAPQGLTAPLAFQAGVEGEFAVNGADIKAAATGTRQGRWSPHRLVAAITSLWEKYVG